MFLEGIKKNTKKILITVLFLNLIAVLACVWMLFAIKERKKDVHALESDLYNMRAENEMTKSLKNFVKDTEKERGKLNEYFIQKKEPVA